MENKVVGLDIGKSWFHFVGCNRAGRPIARHKFNRAQLMQFMGNLPPSLVGIEACPGSEHLARAFQRHGHDVRLIAPKFIKAYLKSQKNDFNDAEAIAEAVGRPTMRFLTVKSNEQLDLQALHRIRERLVRQRTSIINPIRAFLVEYGVAIKEGRALLRRELPGILENPDNGLSDRMRQLLARLRDHWKYLDQSIDEHTHELERIAKRDDACRRLATVPGIGPIGATALVASVGNGAAFARGRELAAWLGLVPRQHSTGGKPTMLDISKRGNAHVRKLLVHGARSLLKHLHRENHEIGLWMMQLKTRCIARRRLPRHRRVLPTGSAGDFTRMAVRSTPRVSSLVEKNGRHRPHHWKGLTCADLHRGQGACYSHQQAGYI